MTQIPGDVAAANSRLDDYPDLKSCVDPARFATAVANKYPSGAEIADGELFDLYTSLLICHLPQFRQEGQNQATPDGALFGISAAIASLGLDAAAKENLGKKLCNLRTTSMWDTLSELLLAQQVVRGLAGSHRVFVEYGLDPNNPPPQGKDADVAIVPANGRPFLIDAVCPRHVANPVSAPDQIVEWACRKYDSKFSGHCATNPTSEVGVVVSMLKNEHFYLGFPTKLALGTINTLPEVKLQTKPGLCLVYAASFRCPGGRLLVFDPMARWSR